MSVYALFQMHAGLRAELIQKNLFYLQQAKKRLILHFDEEEICNEANAEGERFLEEHGHLFDPDRHDPSDFYEVAGDRRNDHYQMLVEMRDNVRLSVAAGLFHEWEKSLRQWLVDEIQHWHVGGNVWSMVWKRSFEDLVKFLESFGWEVRDSVFFRDLDACRLVVNVYKHGNGPSLTELDGRYPQYLHGPFRDLRFGSDENLGHASYEYLKVNDEDVEAFCNAISAFWRDLPENVLNTQIVNPPDWFVRAYEKDQHAGGVV